MHQSDDHAVLTRAVTCLSLYLLAPWAQAGEHDHGLCVSLAAQSDYVFRGISQTMRAPALQASLDAELGNGYYGFLWGSTVDFVPDGDPDDGARVEIDAGIGYQTELNDSWSADLSLVHYAFPGTVAGVDYDYSEIMTTLAWRDTASLTLGYSNDVFGSGTDGLLTAIVLNGSLPADIRFSLRYGYYDLGQAFRTRYSFYEFGVGRELGPVDLNLTYHDTAGDTDAIADAGNTGPQFVVSVQWAR